MQEKTTSLMANLHAETAVISWHELQRFFAKGSVLFIDSSLDLVKVACYFAQDAADDLAPLLESEQVVKVSDEQAKAWFEQNTHLWSVVVAPFVLVQSIVESEVTASE